MQAKNPFKYGVVVTGKDFVDRKKEIEMLKKNLLAGQSIILYSPRRLGKTSLMKKVMHLFPKQVIPIYIDLFGVSSEKKLVKKMVNELMISMYPKLTMLRSAIQKLLSKITVKIIIVKDSIELELKTGEGGIDEELEEIFDLPEKIAVKKGKKIIVMFDEFQDISELDGGDIEKIMRSKFQHHRNVSYLFAGSRISMMRTLFDDPTHAFYRFGKEMNLGNIQKKEFASFIKTKFEITSKKIDAQAVEKILDFTDGHPYFTQKLCQQLWYDAFKTADENMVIDAIQKIARTDAGFYEQIWNSLPMSQRRLLVGLAAEPEANKYTQEFINKFDLKTTAHVKQAFDYLEKKRIIEDREIEDIFFSEWIKMFIP